MGRKVSVFGVRGAGKTCYIYAMAQVMQAGATYNDTTISLIANDIKQQRHLNNGYADLADHKWPMGSQKTTDYDFKVRLQYKDEYKEIIPSLVISDYRGGTLEIDDDNDDEFEKLFDSFANSCAIVFLVDGETLLHALDPMDVAPQHRVPLEANQILSARNQISFVENLFMEYKKRNHIIPPVMIAITKSDLFYNKEEIDKGKKLIKRYLPSVFAKGSGIDAAITSVSLGDNLSRDEHNRLYGNLLLNTSRNIHLPIIYALYAYLDSVFDDSTSGEQSFIDDVLFILRRMFEGRVEMYYNGKPAFESK